jgi:hypothetical protein
MGSDSHDIDLRAILLFRGLIRPNWIAHEESNDYGIDYRVERFENGAATGRFFFAQLKGQLSTKLIDDGKYVSYKLKIKHIMQYESLHAPVFLIIADLKRDKAYWIFVQRHVNEMRDQSWRKRSNGTVSIRVPTSNLVSTGTGMLDALIEARKYIANQYIHEGIEYEEELLKELDPLHNVVISATSEAKKYSIQSKIGATVRYILDPALVKEEEYDKLHKGLPVEFSSNALSIEGSPLWDWLTDNYGHNPGVISFIARRRGNLQLSRINFDGTIKVKMPIMPCEFEGGIEEMRFSSSSPFEIFKIEGKYSSPVYERSPFQYCMDGNGWRNHQILDLPLFEEISELIDICNDDAYFIKIDFYVDGIDPFYTGLPVSDNMPSLEGFRYFVGILAKARRFAKLLGVNPSMPKELSSRQLESINMLIDIMEGRRIELLAPTQKIMVTLSYNEAQSTLERLEKGELIEFFLEMEDSFSFFGIQTPIYILEHGFTSMDIVGGAKIIRKKMSKGTYPIFVECMPTTNSTHYMQKSLR